MTPCSFLALKDLVSWHLPGVPHNCWQGRATGNGQVGGWYGLGSKLLLVELPLLHMVVAELLLFVVEKGNTSYTCNCNCYNIHDEDIPLNKTLAMALKPHKHDNKSIRSWIKMEIPLKNLKDGPKSIICFKHCIQKTIQM